MPPRKLQPALAGGAFLGVLSALPLVQMGNCCCCLWMIGGGLVAAWVMQQNHPRPVTIGDGALAGFLAGAVGAVIYVAVSLPVQLVTGPMQARWIQRAAERVQDMPDNLRIALEAARDRDGSLVWMIVGLIFMSCLGLIFSTIGGMLGALFFRSETPPPPGTVEVLPPEIPREGF
jgi:hypothetical protein